MKWVIRIGAALLASFLWLFFIGVWEGEIGFLIMIGVFGAIWILALVPLSWRKDRPTWPPAPTK